MYIMRIISNILNTCLYYVTEAILADDEWLWISMWILAVTRPCRDWYGKERHMVRDRKTASEFNIRYACGDFLKAVGQMLDFNQHDLSNMLILDNLNTENALVRVSEDHPLVKSQDEIAGQLWRMCLCTSACWIVNSAPRMWSFPSAFLGLLHPDQDLLSVVKVSIVYLLAMVSSCLLTYGWSILNYVRTWIWWAVK